MNNLYEYIDPIASPYEAFLFDSTRDLLPIPAHWHYYVELLYVRKGEIEVSLDNVVSTCTKGAVILFPPKCVHSIALARGSSPVQYDVIKFDPNLLPSCKTDEIDLRAMLHGIHAYRCPCIFSPGQTAQMNLFPLFSDILSEYQNKEFGYSMVLTADLRKIVTKFARIWQKNGDFFRYNMTCKEYITATRINAAENMLLFSSHDISFIAREVGYTDCSYFIRCYKKLKGVTPKQARKLQLGR